MSDPAARIAGAGAAARGAAAGSHALSAVRSRPAKVHAEPKLEKAAQKFESYLLEQLLRGLEKTAEPSGGRSFEAGTYHEAVAKRGGIGVADLLVRHATSQGAAAAGVGATDSSPEGDGR